MNASAIFPAAASHAITPPDEPPSPARVPLAPGSSPGPRRNESPAEQRAAAGAQFEAILVRQLLGKTVTSMLGTGEGAAATIYGDLLAETIATQLSAGRGLGLGRMLAAQLAPRGAPAPTAAPFPHP